MEYKSPGPSVNRGIVVDPFITFTPLPKLARLHRDIIVTEKIDGTNAQVIVSADGKQVRAASRKRFIDPKDDNAGFARWVAGHEAELLELGPGQHFGEWWGSGIQRSYGLKEKRFSLFNTSRWEHERPVCCDVVPTLYAGPFSETEIQHCMDYLARNGSRAAPGFMRPEGVVIFHTHSSHLYKYTLDKHDGHKGAAGGVNVGTMIVRGAGSVGIKL